MRVQGPLEVAEDDPRLGVGRDLDGAHAQALDGFQDAEVGGGLDGDRIPRPGHRAQAEVEGLDPTARDDEVLRRDAAAEPGRVARDLPAQLQ
ncbi:hypothetical protein D3C87_1364060 [compost metagenome]